VKHPTLHTFRARVVLALYISWAFLCAGCERAGPADEWERPSREQARIAVQEYVDASGFCIDVIAHPKPWALRGNEEVYEALTHAGFLQRKGGSYALTEHGKRQQHPYVRPGHSEVFDMNNFCYATVRADIREVRISREGVEPTFMEKHGDYIPRAFRKARPPACRAVFNTVALEVASWARRYPACRKHDRVLTRLLAKDPVQRSLDLRVYRGTWVVSHVARALENGLKRFSVHRLPEVRLARSPSD